MADVRLTAEWCEAKASEFEEWANDARKGTAVWEAYIRSLAIHRLAALALRYAEARHDAESCKCHHHCEHTGDHSDAARDALYTYAHELTRPSAAEEA